MPSLRDAVAEALARKLHWLDDPERAAELADAVLAVVRERLLSDEAMKALEIALLQTTWGDSPDPGDLGGSELPAALTAAWDAIQEGGES